MSKHLAFYVPDLERYEHEALKALCEGLATPEQQETAVAVIVTKIAAPQETPYVPGSFDQSAFLAGRAFVGTMIRYYKRNPVPAEVTDENQ